ncbi:bifunctional helix-turn-helix transcriptional regulator/GNAT family N-acetyltransferase [Desulfocurvus sp. DL9XJH121]
MQETQVLRRFSRFYTRVLGLFHPGLLGSERTLLEARILYEICADQGRSSADLARGLGVDRGYLSRVVARLVRAGLVTRPEGHAGRRGVPLSPTPRGREALRDLETRSDAQAGALLRSLDGEQRRRLTRALDEARALLSKAGPEAPAEAPAGDVVLRPARVGEAGWIIHRYARAFHESHGFNEEFEKYLVLGVAELMRAQSPKSGLWVADRGGEFLGCVGVVQAEADRAQLRWLLVEPSARGLGLGRRLVEHAVAFARERGYAGMLLWTLDGLGPALALYASLGFRLTESAPGTMGGVDCVEQRLDLDF